jgi:phosphate-selective porin OprO/OprP
MAWTASAEGQARSVAGTVRSSSGGVPVADVVVRLKGTLTSVRTTAAGTFVIEVPAQSPDILVLTHPDHDPLEVDLAGRATLEITLVSNVRYNQYGVRVPRVPLAPEVRDGILVFESKDGDYRFWFDMRINVDGAYLFGDSLNENGSGVEMRRARIGVKAQFTPTWYGEVDMDFADSRADLKDAYLMYSSKSGLDIRMGNFKEAFSLEQQTTSRYVTFLERAMVVRALTPSRRIGVQAAYGRPYILLAGGIHFQDVGGWEEVQNRKDNNSATGADEGYSLTGKLTLMPFYHDKDKGVHAAVAGSYRTPKTDDEVGKVRYSTRGPANINRKKYLDTDRMSDVSHSILGGFELAAFSKGLRIQGEYDLANVYSKTTVPVEKFNGFYVFTSAMLFGGKYQYNTRDGEFTQPKLGRGWGDLEVAARYEYLDLNSRKAGVMGGAGEAVTLGVNVYPNNNVKFMLNYSYINHDRYANGRGRLYVGTDAAGKLTTDPALVAQSKGKAGEDYSAISVRVQVAF